MSTKTLRLETLCTHPKQTQKQARRPFYFCLRSGPLSESTCNSCCHSCSHRLCETSWIPEKGLFLFARSPWSIKWIFPLNVQNNAPHQGNKKLSRCHDTLAILKSKTHLMARGPIAGFSKGTSFYTRLWIFKVMSPAKAGMNIMNACELGCICLWSLCFGVGCICSGLASASDEL